MRHRSFSSAPRSLALLALCLSVVIASWAGCGSGGTAVTTDSGGTTSGTSMSSMHGTSSGTGGSGGSGGSGGGVDAGPMCKPTEKICGGVCVDPGDPNFGCSTTGCDPCPPFPNGTATCSGGQCMLAACNPGAKDCNGNAADGCETDINGDPNNCGDCTHMCQVAHATPGCKMGQCSVGTCDMGWTDCNGDPIDGCEANLQNDPKNCGMCGKSCVGQEQCQLGVCKTICGKGKADCNNDPNDGCETPLDTNDNCAFCGDTCALANSNSTCDMMGVCNLNQCNTGWGNCDMMAGNGCETNTQTDVNNCNGCGNVCAFGPHSQPTCVTGGCGIICDPGWSDCDNNPNNGCEVHSDQDIGNCGGCGNVDPKYICTTANGTPSCIGGQCGIAMCNTGFTDCDTLVPDGCEVNTAGDPQNCGMCSKICSAANANAGCSGGLCNIAQCLNGYLDCSGGYADGCETNGNADISNCGMCGKVCSVANGSPTCSNGTCAIANCTMPYADCANGYSDGCETNTNTNPQNCGSCGHACVTPNATPACSNGTCAVGMCNTGYKDCNGTVADGCEINILNDPNNCGGCNTKCTVANGVGACVNGMCKVGTCNTGFTDCDGNPANGCETATGTDPSNCGTCMHVCNVPNATASCTGGICTVGACSTGWTDCNNQPGDGCEVHTSADVNNCGGCFHQCSVLHGSAGCSAGNCFVAGCTAPYADCVNGYSDGCETDTSSSGANCGMCGKNCGTTCVGNVASTACSAGSCTITACAGNFTNNDGQCSNGCECANSITPTSCGSATNLGNLNPGQSITPFQSTLMPVMVGGVPNTAWVAITFNGNGGTSYHPKITLTDPTGEFVMDVQSNCSTAISTCTDNGTNASRGVTTFETSYLGPSPAGDPTSKDINGNSNFTAIGVTGTLYVHIYRKNPNGATTCNQYTLSVSG